MDPLGTVVAWLAECGVIGLAIVAFVERLVPMLPSHLLLVATGIAVADGRWSLRAAVLAYTTGSIVGCLPFHRLALGFGETRSNELLERSVGLLGIAAASAEAWIAAFRRRAPVIAFFAAVWRGLAARREQGRSGRRPNEPLTRKAAVDAGKQR